MYFLLGVASVLLVRASTYTIYTADYSDRGWYDNTGYRDLDTLGNYIVGTGGYNEYRNFFIFDLSVIPVAETVVSAQFVIYNTPYVSTGIGGYQSSDESETYQLFSIDYTDFSVLRSGAVGLTSAFNDLADGEVFNTGTIFTADSSDAETTMYLSATFISYAQTHLGGEVGFGGALTSLGGNYGQTLFTNSHSLDLSASRLIITTVPEPSVWAVISGGCALILALWRRLT